MTPRPAASPQTSPTPLTPTEVNAVAAQTLENSDVLRLLATSGAEGEVTNFKGASKSGHWFFSIKDETAELPLVVWSGRAARGGLPDGVGNGMRVVAFGKLTIWQKRGDYRLVVDRMREAGRGEIWARVEETRRRLAAEGLMDPARKRALPKFPRRIGIATSAQGAVIHDVTSVLSSRWPLVTLVLRSIPVQGAGAEEGIAAGLLDLARRGACDVILLCRGGGSAEDLLPFSSEIVARTVRRVSEEFGIPVVTGIGHAEDHSIADDCADRFAPVPAEAAAAVVPDQYEIRRALSEEIDGIAGAFRARLDRAQMDLTLFDRARRSFDRRTAAVLSRLALAGRALAQSSPRARLARSEARLVAAGEALPRLAGGRIEHLARGIAAARQRLEDLSPLAVLGRGYALVFDEAGRVLRRAAAARRGEDLRVRLSEGELRVQVKEATG